MKILIDVRLLGRGAQSGIEEYTRELVSYLLRADTKNQYQFLYTRLRKQPLPSAWMNRPNTSLLDWRVPNKFLDAAVRLTGAPKIDNLTDADIVFSPHFNLLKTARARRLVTFHDLSFLHHPDFFSKKQRLWHWLQDYRTQAEDADHIIAVSAFTKADLIETLGIPEEKISVIYSGISPEFRPLPAENEVLQKFREIYRLDFPFLLYLGTLEPRKNLVTLIEAFGILKHTPRFHDLRLILAGRPGWLYRDIIRERNRSHAKEDIVFWGPVANTERVFLYNLAEVFVYPSFFEGFGFPPLEAQACGAPVIAGNRTALPEVLGDSALLIDPWRTKKLAEAIEEVLVHPATKKQLAAKGLANAARFPWETTAKKLLELMHG